MSPCALFFFPGFFFLVLTVLLALGCKNLSMRLNSRQTTFFQMGQRFLKNRLPKLDSQVKASCAQFFLAYACSSSLTIIWLAWVSAWERCFCLTALSFVLLRPGSSLLLLLSRTVRLFSPFLFLLLVFVPCARAGRSCDTRIGDVYTPGENFNLTFDNHYGSIKVLEITKMVRETVWEVIAICPGVQGLEDAYQIEVGHHCESGSGSRECGKTFGGFDTNVQNSFTGETLFWADIGSDGAGSCFVTTNVMHCVALTPRQGTRELRVVKLVGQHCSMHLGGKHYPIGKRVTIPQSYGPDINASFVVQCPVVGATYAIVYDGVLIRATSTAMHMATSCPVYKDLKTKRWVARRALFSVSRESWNMWDVAATWTGVPEGENVSVSVVHGNDMQFKEQSPILGSRLTYQVELCNMSAAEIHVSRSAKTLCSSGVNFHVDRGSWKQSTDGTLVFMVDVTTARDQCRVACIPLMNFIVPSTAGFPRPGKYICSGAGMVIIPQMKVEHNYGHDALTVLAGGGGGGFGFGGLGGFVSTITSWAKLLIPVVIIGALIFSTPSLMASPTAIIACVALFLYFQIQTANGEVVDGTTSGEPVREQPVDVDSIIRFAGLLYVWYMCKKVEWLGRSSRLEMGHIMSLFFTGYFACENQVILCAPAFTIFSWVLFKHPNKRMIISVIYLPLLNIYSTIWAYPYWLVSTWVIFWWCTSPESNFYLAALQNYVEDIMCYVSVKARPFWSLVTKDDELVAKSLSPSTPFISLFSVIPMRDRIVQATLGFEARRYRRVRKTPATRCRNVRNMEGNIFYSREYKLLKEILKTMSPEQIMEIYDVGVPMIGRREFDLEWLNFLKWRTASRFKCLNDMVGFRYIREDSLSI